MMTAGALPLATCALVVAVLAQAGAPAPSGSPYGKPEVMKFKGGRPAAFSMQFDDSIDCQAVFAIPEMNKRGLVGTFFVNPALDRYKRHAEVWEVVCPKYGHELANHTMHHAGAKDDEDAAYEIGECSRQIWKIYPNGSKLRPFLSGGGTEWNCSRETRRALMRQYYLFSGMGGFRGAEGQPERGSSRAKSTSSNCSTISRRTATRYGSPRPARSSSTRRNATPSTPSPFPTPPRPGSRWPCTATNRRSTLTT
jgi:hypothetical protein